MSSLFLDGSVRRGKEIQTNEYVYLNIIGLFKLWTTKALNTACMILKSLMNLCNLKGFWMNERIFRLLGEKIGFCYTKFWVFFNCIQCDRNMTLKSSKSNYVLFNSHSFCFSLICNYMLLISNGCVIHTYGQEWLYSIPVFICVGSSFGTNSHYT